MNTSTGEIINLKHGEPTPSGFVEVKRPLTIREQHKQKINKYAPCGCGSGKKFKFCCHKK